MRQNLGTRQPGSTVYLYFDTFDGGDGSSITLTGLALADVIVIKDGSVTQRASTSGFSLLDTDGIDFDSRTGLHGLSIDTSDDTTADFWKAGSHYAVAVDDVTVDGQTVRFWLAEFRLGYEGAMLDTHIATLSSQTTFTLAAGPADDDALNGCRLIVHDKASGVQLALGVIEDYTGSTRTVALATDPSVFTMAAGDNVSVFAPALVPTVPGRTLAIESDGHAHADVKQWLSSAPNALQSGRVDTYLGALAANVITAASIAANAIGASQIASGALTAAKFAAGAFDAVWSVTSRLLTAGTNIVLAKGTGITGFNDVSATQVNAECDTALSDYDAPTRAEATSDKNEVLSRLGTPAGADVVADIASNKTDLGTLLTRLSEARASYLDFLNIGGAVASQADVQGIGVPLRVRFVAPPQIERPDSGSVTYRLWIYSYGDSGQAEDLDSVPVVAAENNASTDRSGNLGTVTKQAATTGIYYVDYTVADSHALEGLVFKATCTENAVATVYPTSSFVADTTAVDYTAADRSRDDGIKAIVDLLPDGGALTSLAQDSDLSTALANLTTLLTRIPGVVQPQTGDAYDRLATYRLGELLSAALASQPAADSLLGDLTEDDGGVQRFSVNALEQAPAGGGGGGGNENAVAIPAAGAADNTVGGLRRAQANWRYGKKEVVAGGPLGYQVKVYEFDDSDTVWKTFDFNHASLPSLFQEAA